MWRPLPHPSAHPLLLDPDTSPNPSGYTSRRGGEVSKSVPHVHTHFLLDSEGEGLQDREHWEQTTEQFSVLYHRGNFDTKLRMNSQM